MSIFDKITERVGDFFDEVMLPESVRRAHEEAARAFEAEAWDRALKVLQPTLIEHPNIARTHHLVGMSHFRKEEWGRAIAAFERALAIKEHAQSHFYAGLAAEQLGRWADVHRHFNRALGMAEELPFELDLHFGLGRAYRALGRPDKAAKELRAALKLTPGHFDASAALVEALLDRDDVEEAARVLEGLDDVPASGKARHLVLRGEIAERRGDPHAALEAYSQAATEGGTVENDARLGAARNALATGEVGKAAAFLLPVTGRNEAEAVELCALRGRIAEAEGRLEDARKSYGEALARQSAEPDALLGLGRVELAARNWDAAAAHFTKVVRDANPARQQEAWWGIGQCHLQAGDLAGARHLFEEALELDGPRRADLLYGLGRTALMLGDAAEAIVFLRDALEAPNDHGPSEGVQEALDDALERLSPRWDLPDRLDEPVKLQEVLDALLSYLGRDGRLAEFLAPAQKLHTALNSPLSLAIVGEFNAGKSTIVNALVGEDVFPVGVLPTTAHTGILRWGPRKAARVVYLDGTREEQSLDEARQTMKTNAESIERLEFTHPHPDLRLVHYWDTPGFNALEERHEKVAAEALNAAEAILWVMDANQVLSQTEFDRIDILPFGGERLVVVINKIDRLGPADEREDEVEELIEYVTDNLEGRMAGCFAISALQAGSPDESTRQESGFAEFREFLEGNVVQRAGRIKTIEVGRQLERLVFTLDAFQRGLVQRYETFGVTVRGIESWLSEEALDAPRRHAKEEVELLREWTNRALEGVEAEISDALRPTGSWTGRLGLPEEDRQFITSMILERFDRLLDASWQRTSGALTEAAREIAERLDPVVRGLALGDARALQRRLDGFFDEARVLEMLWEERVYGALRARARGRVETAGAATIEAIEASQADRSSWRGALRRLLPTLDDELTRAIEDWYASFFDAATRFCSRVRKDLELLELEARQRYDVRPLLALVQAAEAEPKRDEGNS